MSVARIGETQAKEGKEEELRDFLLSIIPGIKASAGCQSCQLFQSQEEPEKFLMIEVWDSVESHQAAVQEISPEEINRIRTLLAGAPSGRYFDLIGS